MFSCLLFMLSQSHAIYWRAFGPDHIFAIHSECITGAVKSNVWRPPLGRKMQGRLGLDPPAAARWRKKSETRWENCSPWKKRRWVKLLYVLAFFRGRWRSFPVWYMQGCSGTWKSTVQVFDCHAFLNVKRPLSAFLMGFWPASIFLFSPWSRCQCRFYCLYFSISTIYSGISIMSNGGGLCDYLFFRVFLIKKESEADMAEWVRLILAEHLFCKVERVFSNYR